MKKRLILALSLLLLPLVAWAVPDWMVPSASKTASAAVLASPGYFHGITVVTDGTNTATVDVYDNSLGTAAGNKLIPQWPVVSSSTNRVQAYNVYPPIRVMSGITVILSVAGGGSATYMVYYSN
jgi:hypothetical protein